MVGGGVGAAAVAALAAAAVVDVVVGADESAVLHVPVAAHGHRWVAHRRCRDRARLEAAPVAETWPSTGKATVLVNPSDNSRLQARGLAAAISQEIDPMSVNVPALAISHPTVPIFEINLADV